MRGYWRVIEQLIIYGFYYHELMISYEEWLCLRMIGDFNGLKRKIQEENTVVPEEPSVILKGSVAQEAGPHTS